MRLKVENQSPDELDGALKEIFPLLGFVGDGTSDKTLVLKRHEETGLRVEISDHEVVISYSRKCELFRGLGLYREHHGEAGFATEQKAAYRTLGLMADNSRNAVNNIPTLKRLIRHLALMGYNMLMLYMEDTYEVPGLEYFGHMRGRFTREEIREIEDYAGLFGIELVPAIQTLAHMNAIFRWNAFSGIRDIHDILLVNYEETYLFLDKLIQAVSGMFRSRRINIGMDEAFYLGQGQFLKNNGLVSKHEIMMMHLPRVLGLCRSYGLEPMMWSDMFFRNSEGRAQPLSEDILKDVTLIHWDYVTEKEEWAKEAFKAHKKLSGKIMFAGGAWKWESYAPFISYSFLTSRNALGAARACGIDEVIVTAWGDNGGEASLFSVLPVYQLFAEDCYTHTTTDEHVAKRLKACANADLDDFRSLELPQLPKKGDIGGGYKTNPMKYMLFQDVLLGLYDRHVIEDAFAVHYHTLVNVYDQAAANNPEWSYIFELMRDLAAVLELKCDIGIKLKKAYDSGSRAALSIQAERLTKLERLVENFHQSVRKQWLKENKPFGMEVQDIRIGGLKARLDTAIHRLNDYLSGHTDRIEELEQERLYADCRPEGPEDLPHTHCWTWQEAASPCII